MMGIKILLSFRFLDLFNLHLFRLNVAKSDENLDGIVRTLFARVRVQICPFSRHPWLRSLAVVSYKSDNFKFNLEINNGNWNHIQQDTKLTNLSLIIHELSPQFAQWGPFFSNCVSFSKTAARDTIPFDIDSNAEKKQFSVLLLLSRCEPFKYSTSD